MRANPFNKMTLQLALCCAVSFFVFAPGTSYASEVKRMTVEELRVKYGDPKGKIAIVGGVEVYYKDEGEGPAILMVHGSSSTLKTWDGVASKLISKYRVIRYDIPPQGLSGHLSDDAARKLEPVDIAEGLLAQLGVEKITFVGVSSGGTLGIFLAAKRPELVRRLILANTPADTVDPSKMRLSPAFELARREASQTGFQSRLYWGAFFDFYSGDPSRMNSGIREQYYDMNRRVPEPNVLALAAKVADQVKAKSAMSRVRAPTLLVWGARDPLLVPASADALEKYLSGAEVSKIWLSDVGHYPPLEVPARFADIVSAYIESVTP